MKVKLLRTFVLLLSLLVCFSLVLASCDSGSKDGDDETNPTTKTSTSSVLDSGDEGASDSSNETTDSSDETTDSSDEGTTDSSDWGTGDEPCAEHKGAQLLAPRRQSARLAVKNMVSLALTQRLQLKQ